MKVLTKNECLELDIETFNKAIEIQWKKDKVDKNLTGDLLICEFCGRKYAICCICEEAEKSWNNVISEIESVSNQRMNDKI